MEITTNKIDAAKLYDMSHPKYSRLATVLKAAFDQAAFGKGADRHANDLRFEQQPMQTLAATHGIGFLTGQAGKKSSEAHNLAPDAAVRELLGGINYLAGAVIFLQDKHGLDPLAEVRGEFYDTSLDEPLVLNEMAFLSPNYSYDALVALLNDMKEDYGIEVAKSMFAEVNGTYYSKLSMIQPQHYEAVRDRCEDYRKRNPIGGKPDEPIARSDENVSSYNDLLDDFQGVKYFPIHFSQLIAISAGIINSVEHVLNTDGAMINVRKGDLALMKAVLDTIKRGSIDKTLPTIPPAIEVPMPPTRDWLIDSDHQKRHTACLKFGYPTHNISCAQDEEITNLRDDFEDEFLRAEVFQNQIHGIDVFICESQIGSAPYVYVLYVVHGEPERTVFKAISEELATYLFDLGVERR